MIFIQGLMLVITTGVLFILVFNLSKKFERKDILPYVFIPLLIFIVGFGMRLSVSEPVVDMGFFFTEVSYILLTVLFVMALFLGQLKYWKK